MVKSGTEKPEDDEEDNENNNNNDPKNKKNKKDKTKKENEEEREKETDRSFSDLIIFRTTMMKLLITLGYQQLLHRFGLTD